jgi:hypothetical protein
MGPENPAKSTGEFQTKPMENAVIPWNCFEAGTAALEDAAAAD